MNKPYKLQRGFTIIEVVLVLAIAALIFLMIFVALPALQAGQRDTARKNDASIVSSAVTKYTAAYRSAVKATTSEADLQKYVDNLDQYEKTDVKIRTTGDPTTSATVHTIFVYPSSKCNGPDADDGGNDRQTAVRIQLEDGTYYCVDAS